MLGWRPLCQFSLIPVDKPAYLPITTLLQLADFGYAVQVWPDEPGLRSQCGTPCYIAPEILRQDHYGKVRG